MIHTSRHSVVKIVHVNEFTSSSSKLWARLPVRFEEKSAMVSPDHPSEVIAIGCVDRKTCLGTSLGHTDSFFGHR